MIYKACYDQIIKALVAYESDIRISERLSSEEMGELMNYLKAIDPSLFHVTGLSLCASMFGTLTICPDYAYTKEEYAQIKKSISDRIRPLKQYLRTLDGDLKKEKYIHDYICTNIKYVDNGAISHTLVGPFLHGEGVCDGISQATQLLLKSCGIKSYLVTGTAYDGKSNGPHGWNLVNIDGKWYHLDVTFDRGISQGFIRYDYFNLNHRRISLDHNLEYSPIDSKKECVTENDFFDMRKISFSDMAILKKYFLHVLSKRKEHIQIRLDGKYSQELYNKVNALFSEAVNETRISVSMGTTTNPTQNVIGIVIKYQ